MGKGAGFFFFDWPPWLGAPNQEGRHHKKGAGSIQPDSHLLEYLSTLAWQVMGILCTNSWWAGFRYMCAHRYCYLISVLCEVQRDLDVGNEYALAPDQFEGSHMVMVKDVRI